MTNQIFIDAVFVDTLLDSGIKTITIDNAYVDTLLDSGVKSVQVDCLYAEVLLKEITATHRLYFTYK